MYEFLQIEAHQISDKTYLAYDKPFQIQAHGLLG